ncbi:MAG: ComEC/Rec2 family competence protein, partial [Puniceicoccales bacterium]|nr:ComEC/Rec2 family competence protein [Puniceicoccales bacterium]
MIFSPLFGYTTALLLGCLGAGLFFNEASMATWVVWGTTILGFWLVLPRRGLGWFLALGGGILYAGIRLTPPPFSPLPPREARLVIQVERLFRPSESKVSGIARTNLAEGKHLKKLKGKRIYFSVSRNLCPPLEGGETLELIGVLTPETPFLKDEKFSYFLWTNNVSYRLSRIRHLAVLPPLSPRFFQWNAYCERVLSAGLPQSEATHIYKAMLLGKKNDLSTQTWGDFVRTGTLHLFAISGFHVGIIGTLAWGCFFPFPFSRNVRLMGILVVTGLYVFVVGYSPSTVRAFTMMVTWTMAQTLSRPSSSGGTLAVSLFLTLLWNPRQLFDVGFQLSYGIV